MKTIGEILTEARLKKRASVEDVARQTKIQSTYLRHIEANKFSQLPSATFVRGFIKNYARAVGVKPDTALAVFRRDFVEDRRGNIVPRGLTQPLTAPSIITPRRTIIAAFSALGILIALFFIRQIIVFYTAPSLDITIPIEGEEVTSPFKVQGTTQSDASVIINDQPVTVDTNGEFTADIQLSPGQHTLIISSTNRSGRTGTTQRTITVIEQ